MFNRNRFKEKKLGNNWKILTPGRILDTSSSQQYVVNNLFKFILDNEISISKNTFQHEVAIDNEGILNNMDVYDEWCEIFEYNKKNAFKKDELLVGHTYLSDDGKEYLYLGYKYIQKWKVDTKDAKISLTKEKKVHLVRQTLQSIDYSSPYGKFCKVLELTPKIKLVEKTKAKEQSVYYLLEAYKLINHCVYFSDIKGSNSGKFEMVEITNDKEFFESLKKSNVHFYSVFFKSENAYVLQKTDVNRYTNDNPYVEFDVSDIYDSVYDLDLKKIKINNPFDWSSNLDEFIDEKDFLEVLSKSNFERDTKRPPHSKGLAKSLFIPRVI